MSFLLNRDRTGESSRQADQIYELRVEDFIQEKKCELSPQALAHLPVI